MSHQGHDGTRQDSHHSSDLPAATEGAGAADEALIEALSDQVHAEWMGEQRRRGRTSSIGRDGEEYMVPYAQLTEAAKELDRVTVRAVLGALRHLGYTTTQRGEAEDAAMWLALIVHNAGGEVFVPDTDLVKDWWVTRIEDIERGGHRFLSRVSARQPSGRGVIPVESPQSANATKAPGVLA